MATRNPPAGLKPCPFCGGRGDLIADAVRVDRTEYFVRCRTCAAQGPWYQTEGNAIRCWNERRAGEGSGE